MAKIAAWHSSRESDPKVYHDQSACTEGNNIEQQYRRPGMDNRRQCDHCKRLS